MNVGPPPGDRPLRENALTRLALDQLRLRLVAATFRRAFLSTLVASVCVGYFFYQGVALGYLIGWIALAAGSIAVRRGFALRYLSAPPADPGPALRTLVVLSGLVGFMHGAVAIIFLPYISPRDQAVVTMIVLCWCAGSIIVGSIAPRAYYAFVTLAATPFAIFWLLYGGDGGTVIAALIALMFVMVALYTRDAERVLIDSFYLRHQNEDLLRRLELANQRRATFIEFLNHDLRNALGVVGMGLATLSLKSQRSDDRPILEGARQGLDWARGLIDALDELAQLDAGAVPVRPERVSLAHLAAAMRRTFASAAGEKNLALTCTAPATAVLIDRRLLNRVLQNLVDNAIKYTPHGSVAVRGSYASGQLVWEVEDTGPGIPAAEREHVFDEFYQIDNPERAREKGRGLGLSVVRRFVALMGGTVAIDHGAHGGARFVVTMPCELAADETVTAPNPTEPIRADREVTVWIIEDQTEARDGLERLLRTLGYTVRPFDEPEPAVYDLACATRANAAYSEGESNRSHEGAKRATDRPPAESCPDAILCDLRLRAGKSGLEVARTLRHHAPDLPIAIVTGEAATDRLEQLKTAGFTVLRKPLDVQALTHWLAASIPT